MLTLRPLLVVTGTVRIEGGEKSRTRQTPAEDTSRGDKEQLTSVRDVVITKERRRANVIAVDFFRLLHHIRICRTPFGTLVDPAKRPELLTLLDRMDKRIAEFNTDAGDSCWLTNCVIWERLAGNRQAATAGWLARHAKDAKVKDVLAQLRASA